MLEERAGVCAKRPAGNRHAVIAQLVEHWTLNPVVAGSIPVVGNFALPPLLNSSGLYPGPDDTRIEEKATLSQVVGVEEVFILRFGRLHRVH